MKTKSKYPVIIKKGEIIHNAAIPATEITLLLDGDDLHGILARKELGYTFQLVAKPK